MKQFFATVKQFFTKVFSKIKPIHLIILAAALLILGAVLGLRLFLKPGLTFPANTTIVPTKGAYAFKNTTNEFQTQFKAKFTDPDSIVFKNDLGKISFYTPAGQSFGDINSDNLPVADGSTITYPAIFPSIDLRYTISSSRLLEEFIIKDAETAGQISRIEQRAQTKSTYVENDDGSITFYNKENQEAFTLPHPVMYETGNPENKSEGIIYEIKKDGDQLVITKVITEEGQAWLADPKRVYPIAIDLVIDNADTSSNWVSSDPTNTTVSQETTIKQEGSGSVKVQTTAVGAPVTVDLMEYSSNGTAQSSFVTNSATANATGGTITTSGGYTIHTFTSSGTFTSIPGVSSVKALVVAGGGGGGGSIDGHGGSGGGGAGGYLYNTSLSVTAQAYSVTVGGGGGGRQGDARGYNGGNSIFSTLTAIGGGGGGSGYGSSSVSYGSTGGSGGGTGYHGYTYYGGVGGTAGQGNSGGGNGGPSGAGGGGGGGAGGAGAAPTNSPLHNGGTGGVGLSNSITGSTVFYAGGGGGGQNSVGGNGGGGNGGVSGTPNTGGGGGGVYGSSGSVGGNGGSGVVIISYVPPTNLQSYSEATIKTQGTYALKGFANQTTSLNKTLTRTIASPLNLSDKPSVTFDIRASRTGSNIKVGLHDSGGTTTEVTPNITQADTFQSTTIDLSGVTNANKDAIDQIIITIVNADAANTFYLDNMVATPHSSVNDTVTRTTAATDLSTVANLTYWVRSSVAGSYATFGFGESAATEQTNTITIAQANTWEQKSWNIESISAASRNAVTKFAFTFTGDTSGASFYFDDIQTNALFAPTLGVATGLTDTSIRWNFTDNSGEETGFKIYDSTGTTVLVTCAGTNLTYCDETGLSLNTQYTRKIGAYNASSASIASGTVSGYTLAAVPAAPVVTSRAATTVSVNPDPGTNPAATQMAIYREEGSTCDGAGGVYLAANGSSNGATAVWQTDATWGTVTATGLTSEKSYVFCAKAKNSASVETSFSSVGSHNAGFIPLSGDYVCTQDTVNSSSFTNRYADGNTPGRYVIALDKGGYIATINIDLMEYSSNSVAQAAYVTNTPFSATGGTITNVGGYTIHTFTSSGTFTVTSGSGNVEVLVVGGGGGAGSSFDDAPGGGGGAASQTTQNLTAQSYTVTVGGAGGTGGTSSFGSLVSANGGGQGIYGAGTGGISGSGYPGGDPHEEAGGGGGGATGGGGGASRFVGGGGGAGLTSSISGSSVGYGGGGGGAGSAGWGGSWGSGYGRGGQAGNGGSGIVIVRYIDMPLQSYSEATIKTQGTYALKGVANQTTSLNKTLTRTIGTPLNLSNSNSATFDLKVSRTGSNIKIGLHDSGGTVTEVTPNITQTDTFQSVTVDLSGVTNANKDAIDQIIITIINADAANTFYLDNMVVTTETIGTNDNNSVFEAKSCIMTLNSSDTLVVGSLSLTGGSIAIADGAIIKIKQPVWIIDADGDGYSSDGKLYYGVQPAGGRRKYFATTLVTGSSDCNDASYSLTNVCCITNTRYQDADGDGYGNPSVSIFACPTAGYVDNNTDCYDANANAKPGSTTCSATNRGDGSFDYNCSGGNTVCGTQYYHYQYQCVEFRRPNQGCPCYGAYGNVITSPLNSGECGASGNVPGGCFGEGTECQVPCAYTAPGAGGTQACQ